MLFNKTHLSLQNGYWNKQWILFVWSGSIPQLRISHKMSFDSFATKDSLSYAYRGKGIQENYWFEYGLLFARH